MVIALSGQRARGFPLGAGRVINLAARIVAAPIGSAANNQELAIGEHGGRMVITRVGDCENICPRSIRRIVLLRDGNGSRTGRSSDDQYFAIGQQGRGVIVACVVQRAKQVPRCARGIIYFRDIECAAADNIARRRDSGLCTTASEPARLCT